MGAFEWVGVSVMICQYVRAIICNCMRAATIICVGLMRCRCMCGLCDY